MIVPKNPHSPGTTSYSTHHAKRGEIETLAGGSLRVEAYSGIDPFTKQ